MPPLHNLREFIQCDPANNKSKPSSVLNYYTEINPQSDISNEELRNIARLDTSGRNLFLPVEESALKCVVHTFLEKGLRSALNEALILLKTVNWVARLLDFYENLKIKVFPYAQNLNAENIAKFVETRDWINSPIRYINWHLHYHELAIAGSDDIVRIYGQTTNVLSVLSVLKCSGQTEITCLAWRPYSPDEIVVGCKTGLYHWTAKGNDNTRRSRWQYQVHKHNNHLPVTSLEWNQLGTLLASVGDGVIVIRDFNCLKTTTVKRMATPPCSLLKWSSYSTWLFSTTVGKTFHVWNCENRWAPERWSINEGRIQSACWSPCEKFLVFVSTSERILYRLQFSESSVFADGTGHSVVFAIADLSEFTVGNNIIGGKPQQIVWDPNGRYIAITFKYTNSIVIFRTLMKKFDLKMSALSFISGQCSSEYPNFVTFQSLKFEEKKSVLTIGWSSGRVQFCTLE